MLSSLNFIGCNFLINILTVLIILKIYKIKHAGWYVLLIQIFDVCAGLMTIFFDYNILYFCLFKSASMFFVTLFITDSFSIFELSRMLGLYCVILLSVAGAMWFLALVFSQALENVIMVKISKNLHFIIYFAIILYVFAIFDIVSHLEKRKFLKNQCVWLSFILFNKHIEMLGFVDSGNCLYDSLTKKPVIIVSKKALEKYFNAREFGLFLSSSGRVIECETIAEKTMRLMVYDIKFIKLTINKTIIRKPCVVGVVDKIFDGSKYDCLLHRDFM